MAPSHWNSHLLFNIDQLVRYIRKHNVSVMDTMSVLCLGPFRGWKLPLREIATTPKKHSYLPVRNIPNIINIKFLLPAEALSACCCTKQLVVGYYYFQIEQEIQLQVAPFCIIYHLNYQTHIEVMFNILLWKLFSAPLLIAPPSLPPLHSLKVSSELCMFYNITSCSSHLLSMEEPPCSNPWWAFRVPDNLRTPRQFPVPTPTPFPASQPSSQFPFAQNRGGTALGIQKFPGLGIVWGNCPGGNFLFGNCHGELYHHEFR